MKPLIPIALTVSCTLTLIPTISQANTDMVRAIKPAQKGQVSQMQPIAIGLAPGIGVTISLRQTDQYVVQAWLDNPSFVTLDSNGCLISQNNTCNRPTTVLHLKRIKDLSIPGLPQSPTTLLTVVTEGSDGGGIYVFKIYKSNQPTAIIYELNRPIPPLNTIQPLIQQKIRQEEVRNVENP